MDDVSMPCCARLGRALKNAVAQSALAHVVAMISRRALMCVPGAGPITAEAIFLNREELPVQPLYYDPVHDLGFMRFDPSKLRFMEVLDVPLAPEAAAVGLGSAGRRQ